MIHNVKYILNKAECTYAGYFPEVFAATSSSISGSFGLKQILFRPRDASSTGFPGGPLTFGCA